MGGLQPKWPLVLPSLPLPHAFYKSMYLEVIAVLHYNKHDDVVHACLKNLCFIKVNVFTPSCVHSLLPPCMYPRLPSYIYVFHVTAMHAIHAPCVWEWRHYSKQYNLPTLFSSNVQWNILFLTTLKIDSNRRWLPSTFHMLEEQPALWLYMCFSCEAQGIPHPKKSWKHFLEFSFWIFLEGWI